MQGAGAILPRFLSEKVLTIDFGDAEVPALVREHLSGITLRKLMELQYALVNRESHTEFYPSAKESPWLFCGISDIYDWFSLANWVLASIKELHDQRVTHGFLSPDNIFIPEEALQIIFQKDSNGLFITEGSLFKRAPDFNWSRLNEVKCKFINCSGSQTWQLVDKHIASQLEGGFALRRIYDWIDNLYFPTDDFDNQLLKLTSRGSDYHSTIDIYSFGVTLSYLGHGSTKRGHKARLSPFSAGKNIVPLTGSKKDFDGYERIFFVSNLVRYSSMKELLVQRLEGAIDARCCADANSLSNNWSQSPARELTAPAHIMALRQAEIILGCCRTNMDRRIRNVEHLRSQLEIFRPEEKTLNEWTTDKACAEIMPPANRKVFEETIIPNIGGPFGRLISRDWNSLASQLSNLDSHRYIVSGNRSSVTDAMLSILSTLRKGDLVFALTTPTIWRNINFGPTGRLSSILNICALSGVHVKWLIVLREDDPVDREIAEILALRARDNLNNWKGGRDNDKDGYYSLFLENQVYDELVQKKQQFIGFVKADSLDKWNFPLADDRKQTWPHQNEPADSKPLTSVLIAPDYVSRGGLIGSLMVRANPLRNDLLSNFERCWAQRSEIQEKIYA